MGVDEVVRDLDDRASLEQLGHFQAKIADQKA
jgi:hypothetical protein